MDTAWVTGGSEGVGRGVVEGLAEADMRVYFTGRNAERLARTALEAGRLGGEVIARQVDHRHDDQVVALFDEIRRAGSIDLLVNNVWGGYENMVEDGRFTWLDPYWEQPTS